jgi:predicted enzyme related to lactoylglutathione lyase
MKLSHARIITNDVSALARFYQQITGIAPAGTEDYQEIRANGGTLVIGSLRSMELYGAGATVPASNRSAIVEFQVEDADCKRARIAGIVREFAVEPTDQPWCNRSILFRNSDGNIINFYTPKQRAAEVQPAEKGSA